MPFVRFSRDKRGVENFYLVQATANRRGKVRPRVLYWFRSPPDVKVGREPFDAEVRRALEAQNPGVVFDWRAIVETPIPSADADKWRERRRAERAAKHAAAEEAAAESANGDDAEMPEAIVESPLPVAVAAAEVAAAVEAAPLEEPPSNAGVNRRRRRRRRGGGGGVRSPQALDNGSNPPAASDRTGD